MIEGDCERRIDEYRARVRSQQELIRSRRAEAVTLKQEADRCRAEADSCAILYEIFLHFFCFFFICLFFSGELGNMSLEIEAGLYLSKV